MRKAVQNTMSLAAILASLAGPGLFSAAMAASPQAAAPTTCRLDIEKPGQGSKVGKKMLLEGSAQLPPGRYYVWVLVEVAGLSGWWPQGGGPARLVDGHWRVLTHFGQEDDIGSEFVAYVTVVDDQTNQELRQWARRGDQTGQYPPLASFPNVTDGCPIRELRVIKTSH